MENKADQLQQASVPTPRQRMPCSASHVLQGLCNTLPTCSCGQARSWKHLQAAGSHTLWHMSSAAGCPDPNQHTNATSSLSLLLPQCLQDKPGLCTKASDRLERCCLAHSMSKKHLLSLDALSKGKILTLGSSCMVQSPCGMWRPAISHHPAGVGSAQP